MITKPPPFCFLPVLVLLFSLMACKDAPGAVQRMDATLFVTSMDKAHLLEPREVGPPGDSISGKPAVRIRVDPHIAYQEMDGFGYTLTGGSALNIQRMSDPAKHALLTELFGTRNEQLGVSYLRISIGASDLDEYPWSYDDLPKGETDTALARFSLAYDTLYLVPTLQEILKIAPHLKILGSPWSPPPWMKDNGNTRGGSLKKEYYRVYADYFVKYIGAMEAKGIPIDAITIQNEPLHPGNNPSMLMPAADQAVFVKEYLGPAFKEHGITTRILVYDHNADRPDYPISILNDPDAARYVSGSAFHLYGGKIEALSQVHEAHPEKDLYFTEQWIGAPGNFAGDLTWHIGQLIIGAPRNWCKAVLEWNLAADENQEPHTDRGGCDRCLGAITIQGDEITRNPAYYIIAHASRFVPPGAVRIASDNKGGILNVAYTTPDHIAVILQNTNDKETMVHVQNEAGDLEFTMGAGEVATLVIQKNM